MDMTSYILGRKSQGGGGGGASMPRRVIEVNNGVILTDKNKETLQAIYDDYQAGKINFDGVYLKYTSQDWPSEDTYFALNDIHVNDNKQFGQLKFIDLKTQNGTNVKAIYVYFGLDLNEVVSYISMNTYDMNGVKVLTLPTSLEQDSTIYRTNDTEYIYKFFEDVIEDYFNNKDNVIIARWKTNGPVEEFYNETDLSKAKYVNGLLQYPYMSDVDVNFYDCQIFSYGYTTSYEVSSFTEMANWNSGFYFKVDKTTHKILDSIIITGWGGGNIQFLETQKKLKKFGT